MKVFNKDFPIKVKFKKSIFDDSFVEEGMYADSQIVIIIFK